MKEIKTVELLALLTVAGVITVILSFALFGNYSAICSLERVTICSVE